MTVGDRNHLKTGAPQRRASWLLPGDVPGSRDSGGALCFVRCGGAAGGGSASPPASETEAGGDADVLSWVTRKVTNVMLRCF